MRLTLLLDRTGSELRTRDLLWDFWQVLRAKHAKDKHMPRILRTEERPWGLPSLALKELVQIITSYCLLTFSILMARTMIQTGGI